MSQVSRFIVSHVTQISWTLTDFWYYPNELSLCIVKWLLLVWHLVNLIQVDVMPIFFSSHPLVMTVELVLPSHKDYIFMSHPTPPHSSGLGRTVKYRSLSVWGLVERSSRNRTPEDQYRGLRTRGRKDRCVRSVDLPSSLPTRLRGREILVERNVKTRVG